MDVYSHSEVLKWFVNIVQLGHFTGYGEIFKNVFKNIMTNGWNLLSGLFYIYMVIYIRLRY